MSIYYTLDAVVPLTDETRPLIQHAADELQNHMNGGSSAEVGFDEENHIAAINVYGQMSYDRAEDIEDVINRMASRFPTGLGFYATIDEDGEVYPYRRFYGADRRTELQIEAQFLRLERFRINGELREVRRKIAET